MPRVSWPLSCNPIAAATLHQAGGRCHDQRIHIHDHDPEPPFKLANRVMNLPSDDAAGYAEFEERGAETKAMLLKLLPEGTILEGKRLLDFGCGAGRTLRHFLGEA